MKTIILDVQDFAKFLDNNCHKIVQCHESARYGFTACILNGERYILGATTEDIEKIDNS